MKISLENQSGFRPLAAFLLEDSPSILFKPPNSENFSLATSPDGFEFEKADINIIFTGENGKSEEFKNSRISPLFKDFVIFYSAFDGSTGLARSQDLSEWKSYGKMPEGIGLGIGVDNFVYQDAHVFYFGGRKLKVGLTDNGYSWKFIETELETEDVTVDYVLKTSQGIFVLYHHQSVIDGKVHLEVKTVCFDRFNPAKLIWRTKTSLWEEPETWKGKDTDCIGCINYEGKILSYWSIKGVGIYLVTYPFFSDTPTHEHKHYELSKHYKNPILKPVPEHIWENEAVFNAAAFQDGEKVYLIYRAVGSGYISVLGYAESDDGIDFQKRLSEPIFTGNHHFDSKKPNATFESARKFISGGGYGGCEDPRITKIDDKLYMIYVAFNGMDPPRLAMTSIYYEDFINHRFLWEKPVLISPPGFVDKSGCILPEKINGKYVIFHRIYPNILIDFLPDLNFDGTKWLKGEFKISPRPTMWDSRKIGTGAPPIKTKDGWLLIYQGVNDRDDSKYRIGAMLLDLNDPTKVLYRTNHPIIEPKEYYENNLAKFGVVYPCGAVIKDGRLLVYYGGSDSVTCVASANLEEFLKELKSGSNAHLTAVALKNI